MERGLLGLGGVVRGVDEDLAGASSHVLGIHAVCSHMFTSLVCSQRALCTRGAVGFVVNLCNFASGKLSIRADRCHVCGSQHLTFRGLPCHVIIWHVFACCVISCHVLTCYVFTYHMPTVVVLRFFKQGTTTTSCTSPDSCTLPTSNSRPHTPTATRYTGCRVVAVNMDPKHRCIICGFLAATVRKHSTSAYTMCTIPCLEVGTRGVRGLWGT